jgi:hypothetical protein
MKRKKTGKGMALISVLLLTVLLAMLTVSMVFISTNHLSMMGNAEQKMKALKSAEAAAEYALARLNKEPNWGSYSGSPDPSDNETKNLDGSSWEINFSGSEYLSYNNLQGQTKVDRSSIGDTKIPGSIPAYTAEIICKGKAGNAIKYVKAIFIRNDISPYSLNAEGKIYFAGGDVIIKGMNTDPSVTSPGQIYSNWDPNKAGEDPNTSFSIEQADLFGMNVDVKGGTASAAGKINLNDDPNLVVIRENLGSDQAECDKNMNGGKIIDANKSSCTPDVKAGSFLITPLYYIPDEQQKMVDIINRTSKDKLDLLAPTLVPLPTNATTAATNAGINISNWDNVSYNSGYTSKAYTSAIGVTQDIRKDIPGFSDPNFPLGWDVIEGTNMKVQIGVNVTGTEEVSDPKWYDPWNTSTEGRSGAGTYEKTAAIPTGEATFQLSPNNNSYFPPPNNLAEDGLIDGEKNIGLAKIGADKKTEKFLPPNYASDDLGISTDFKIVDKGSNNYEIEGNFKLERDIYINSPPPPAADTKSTLFQLAGSADNPTVTPSIFRIMGVPYEVSGRKYTLNTSMNMNDHSIYSDSHLIIGVNVEGNGSMVSRGKIAYLHKGINSDDMVSLSDDDLIIQTAPGSNYNINGYLYSNDDVVIEKADPNGPLGGAVIMGTETGDVKIDGSITGMNNNKGINDADPNNANKSINITGVRKKIISYSSNGWGRIAQLRGNSFNVRLMSWFELN